MLSDRSLFLDKTLLSGRTELFGVIGHPVGHSLSPLMHNTAFGEAGINGVYLAFSVTELAGAVSGVRALSIRGLSVTIPHKEAVVPLLDALDPLAERIGAVNTIHNREGRLIGYNTDASGALSALSEVVDIAGTDVAVLGAGGAARAVGFALRDAGGRVTILNRSAGKGEGLAADIGASFHPLAGFRGDDYGVVINTTPLGMHPHVEEMPIPEKEIKEDTVIMDIVYNPLRTRLLTAAESRGARTIDGLAMFVRQGAAQFELWTGKKAPVGLMERAVRAALEDRG